LGGGLAMAFFSFNSTESAPRISSIPREIIYARPPSADESIFGPNTGAGEADRSSGSDAESSPESLPPFSDQTTSSDDVSVETLTLADATMLHSLPLPSHGITPAVDPISPQRSYAWSSPFTEGKTESGFSAVVAPVPEPSTWIMIAIGGGLLAAGAGRKPRR
jgi:hypothetical protein